MPLQKNKTLLTAACAILLGSSSAFVPEMTGRRTALSTTQHNALDINNNVLANCNLPGNFGFDPLHLAHTPQRLVTYRKAELKHSRLAILAVVAIMWSDLHVVDTLGATPLLEGRAFPEFLGACVGLPAALEYYGERVEEEHSDDSSYFPGQLDLDPLHLYPETTTGQQQVQFAEIMAGRVCMVAAAGRITENALSWMGILGEEESLISLMMPLQTTVETVEEAMV